MYNVQFLLTISAFLFCLTNFAYANNRSNDDIVNNQETYDKIRIDFFDSLVINRNKFYVLRCLYEEGWVTFRGWKERKAANLLELFLPQKQDTSSPFFKHDNNYYKQKNNNNVSNKFINEVNNKSKKHYINNNHIFAHFFNEVDNDQYLNQFASIKHNLINELISEKDYFVTRDALLDSILKIKYDTVNTQISIQQRLKKMNSVVYQLSDGDKKMYLNYIKSLVVDKILTPKEAAFANLLLTDRADEESFNLLQVMNY